MRKHYESCPSGFHGAWPNTFHVGMEVPIQTPNARLVFTVTGVNPSQHGNTDLTLIGTVPSNGFRAVRARLWLRRDQRWFLGVSRDHLAELETQSHDDEDADDDVIRAR